MTFCLVIYIFESIKGYSNRFLRKELVEFTEYTNITIRNRKGLRNESEISLSRNRNIVDTRDCQRKGILRDGTGRDRTGP